MKRRHISIVVLILMVITALAENPAVRDFQNGKGYVKVHYNRTKGMLTISNQTDMNAEYIAELDITVTCTHKILTPALRDRNSGKILSPSKETEEQYTVCNSTYINIPANRTVTVSEGVSNPPQDTNTDYYEDFNVVIGGNNMLVESTENSDMPASDNGGSQKNTVAEPKSEVVSNNHLNPPSADYITCRVHGSPIGNIATVTTPVVTSSNQSSPVIKAEVELTQKEGEGKPWTNLVLRVYDGNEIVRTETISINPNFRSASKWINVPKANHTYYVRIACVSCD